MLVAYFVSQEKNMLKFRCPTAETREDKAQMIQKWKSGPQIRKIEVLVYVNCLRNSVATNRPRVFTDSLSSLISLSISCKMHTKTN